MVSIWIRATLDWRDEDAFWAQLPPALEAPVRLWNRTFRIPYHLFRHEVREIARLNHSKVADVECRAWEEIPDGTLVVPVDDDDWFAPQLGNTLRELTVCGKPACVWPSRFLEVPLHWRHEIGRLRRRILPSTPPVFICTTNNYAMVKRPEARSLLASHRLASDWCRADMAGRVLQLSTPLSLMNRTLASTTAMLRKQPPLAREKLLLARYRYTAVYRRPTPRELAWSQPYRAMMAGLMQQL